MKKELKIYLSEENYDFITFTTEGYVEDDGSQIPFYKAIEMIMFHSPEEIERVENFFGGKKRVKRLVRKSRYKKPIRQFKDELSRQGLTLEEWLEQCYALGINPLPFMREKGINAHFSFNSGPLYFGELPIEEYAVVLDSSSNDVQVIRGDTHPIPRK